MKVREKRAKLKESEAELARRHEATRRALEAQARELEERQRALQAERAAWERDTGLSLDDLRRRSLEANSKEWVSAVVASSRPLRGRGARLLSSAASNLVSNPGHLQPPAISSPPDGTPIVEVERRVYITKCTKRAGKWAGQVSSVYTILVMPLPCCSRCLVLAKRTVSCASARFLSDALVARAALRIYILFRLVFRKFFSILLFLFDIFINTLIKWMPISLIILSKVVMM